jgi:hypothetical protein
MADEAPKPWWQTLTAFLTAIAALLAAIAGLLAQCSHPKPPERSDGNASSISNPYSESSPSGHSSGSPSIRQPGIASGNANQPASASLEPKRPARSSALQSTAPSDLTSSHQASGTVSLPATHEYVVGSSFDKARYTLTEASVAPHTGESDNLTVRVRLTGEGQPGYPSSVSSFQFSLLVDETTIKPENYFMDRVPPGEMRERVLIFHISPTVKHATLRILVGDRSAEIPLELSR